MLNSVNVAPIQLSLDQLDTYHGVKILARLIRQWERKSKENTYKRLAIEAGLTPVTVSRIAAEVTKSPRLHTILMILKRLGFVAVRFE